MADIGFIGLGNMGGPMAANLAAAGNAVTAFDISTQALEKAREAGAATASSVAEAAAGREVVITMLPAGAEVSEVYHGEGGVLSVAAPGTLLIDCSTIDVDTARAVASTAAEGGWPLLDAPVSGGVAGAAAGTLTFMVGGEADAVERARPVLGDMGKAVIHAGASGAGQTAKVCNNLILAVSMIGVCEAFGMADRLGLERQTLFDIVSKATGQCWALTSYCPVPGPVASAPSNRDYVPGIYGPDDAEGPPPCPGSGGLGRRGIAARRRGGGALYALLQRRLRGRRFLRHHEDDRPGRLTRP